MINSSTSSEIITYALVIDDIRLTDSGTYSCQADNRIIKLFHLNVVGKAAALFTRAAFPFISVRRTAFLRHQ